MSEDYIMVTVLFRASDKDELKMPAGVHLAHYWDADKITDDGIEEFFKIHADAGLAALKRSFKEQQTKTETA